MKARKADMTPEQREFSVVADRVEHLLGALDADARRTAARQESTRPLKAKVAEINRLGRGSATAERMLQEDTDVERGHGGVQRLIEAPLDRLRKQGRITEAEFNAGDRYRADAYLASVDPAAGTVDWNNAGGGGRSGKVPSMFTSQHIADARMRWRRVNDRISGVVAITARLALVKEMPLSDIGRNVMGHADRKDAAVAGAALVRMMCAALADVYRA